MGTNIRTKKLLFTLSLCLFCAVTACGKEQKDKSNIVIWEDETLFRADQECQEDTERIAAIYLDTCKEAMQADSLDWLEMVRTVINRLGENGFVAIDSGNQVDMTNAEQVLAFCSAVDAKEKAELTIVEIIDIEGTDQKAVNGFRKYDFQTDNGKVDVVRTYYCFDGYGNPVSEDTVSYPADLWQYTAEGYLVFEGSYFADDYYIISLDNASEYAAFRVEPLDTNCRDLYHKYIQPVGYKDNNLFLVNWSEEDFGELDFYDLFDQFYPMVYQQTVPYSASENPGIGAVYRIVENEFEQVIQRYIEVDTDALRSKTAYFPMERSYEYKPRGFYEVGCPNMPYPEVTGYTANSDGTITLTVNAVFPYENTSKAFSHEVVIRTLEDGSFQYVANKITEGDYDAWWHAERLTDDEWMKIYAEKDTSLWYLPHAEDCLLSESEKAELRDAALEAAEQVKEVYQDMEIESGASYDSNVRNFTGEQCKEVVMLLGNAGFVSVADDVDMQNHEKLENFYDTFLQDHDALVTVLNVMQDGLIGSLTFIYRKGELQTYYVGIGWQQGGVPIVKNTLVSNISEMILTEKGYLVYTYEEQIIHSSACQYLRVAPLSEKCRELTRKYVSGLSFVNYNAFVVNWDSGNVDDILMPCMFEDIYRIHTGENVKMENDWIPAEVYEEIMMPYFPVSKEQLRARCGYDADRDSYPYEMIFAVPYSPFGEVVSYTENSDGTITLFVDGVWIDYHSDRAFASEIVVQPFADGTFRYLSNKIQPKQLQLPSMAS